MPEFTAPGVFVEEIPSGAVSIAGVPTSTVGFVGLTERGPIEPQLVTSFGAFARLYGGRIDASYLAWAIEGFFQNGGQRCWIGRITDERGNNDHVKTVDFIGTSRSGLTALALIDEISILAIPDEVRPEYGTGLSFAVIQQCERLKDRFGIVCAPISAEPIENTHPLTNSSYAALYVPWVKVSDRTQPEGIFVPPSGHIAGVYASTDSQRGVHKAPANVTLRGVLDLQINITNQQQELLNPRGVNCLRDFRANGRGIRIWGARTMSADPEWHYISVRRFVIYLQESIEQGTGWVVFEPNDEPLWDKVGRSIENFLTILWRDGALVGARPDEAFFVRCDRTTMTQADLDSGRLVCEIGVALLRPAEFTILRLSQMVIR